MKVIAIDDEPIALDVVELMAGKAPFIDFKAGFTNAFKAMEYLRAERIDLVFLDIKMPDISGMEFLQSLTQKPLVIFTTAYSEHAVESFDLDAVDFLLKPFSLARFMRACNKAKELYTLRNVAETRDYLFVKDGFDQVKVPFDSIEYIEATGNYVSFALRDKKILSRMTISDCEEMLPTERFTRIHRSFIVALGKVSKMERHQVHINGSVIPIGSLYAKNLLNKTL